MRDSPRLKPFAILVLVILIGALGALTIYKHRATRDIENAASQANSVAAGSAASRAAAEADAATANRRPTAAMTPSEVKDAVHAIVAARAHEVSQQSLQNDRTKASLVAAFRSEKPNPVWSAPAEAKLQRIATSQSMTAAGIKATDMAVSCKSTTCHTSASFATSAQADDWVMLYMTGVGTVLHQSAVSRTQNADGSINIDIYSKANP